jgi:hypothetical protein
MVSSSPGSVSEKDMHAARSATLFLLLSCGALAQPAIPAGSPAPAPPVCDVRLSIAAKASRISAEEWVEATGTLENTGSCRRVVLVEPGDGSEVGWRTPVIRWTVRRIAQGRAADVTLEPDPRCGLMNGPYAEAEVFTLAPGHSRRLRIPLIPPRLGSKSGSSLAHDYRSSGRRTGMALRPFLR